MRDLVWAPAHIEFINGADTVALLPVRYAGSTLATEPALQLARKTEWLALAEGTQQYRGLGQRVLATDTGEHGLLDLRCIQFDAVPGGDAAPPA